MIICTHSQDFLSSAFNWLWIFNRRQKVLNGTPLSLMDTSRAHQCEVHCYRWVCQNTGRKLIRALSEICKPLGINYVGVHKIRKLNYEANGYFPDDVSTLESLLLSVWIIEITELQKLSCLLKFPSAHILWLQASMGCG